MDDISWILRAGFIETRLYDLPNFMASVVLVLLGGRLLKAPALHQLVLFFHCMLPLFLYGGVFEYGYMPDILKYWRAFNEIRSGSLSITEAFGAGNVEQAALLLAAFPFPLAVTPASLGYLNVIIYVLIYLWLLSKKVFTPISVWFYLLYPSLALYTGLGLRDTLIFLFMIVAVQLIRENRWFLAIIPLWLLFVIKFQNSLILAPFLLACVVFGLFRTGVSLGKFLAVLFLGALLLFLLAPFVIPEINKFRVAMYIEDGGDLGGVQTISGVRDFMLSGFVSGIYFLVKPLPWEASNFFQLVQSVENIIVAIFILFLVLSAWRIESRKLMVWLLFLIFSFTIYGLVVFNYGTAARYRFPFIVLFVLFVCADCHVNRLIRIRFGKKAISFKSGFYGSR